MYSSSLPEFKHMQIRMIETQNCPMGVSDLDKVTWIHLENLSRVLSNAVLFSSPLVAQCCGLLCSRSNICLCLIHPVVLMLSSPTAFLAYGNRLCPRFFGCLRHSMDGKQLGSGSDSSGCAGRKVTENCVFTYF